RRASRRLYHGDVKRLAFWLPPLVWMAMIAWFSTGEFSADQTSRVLGPVFRWLFPGAGEPELAALHAITRKTGHFTEYAVLAALWFVALTHERRLSRPRPASVAPPVARGRATLA